MREVRWLEEQKTLTLTGEPVLEMGRASCRERVFCWV